MPWCHEYQGLGGELYCLKQCLKQWSSKDAVYSESWKSVKQKLNVATFTIWPSLTQLGHFLCGAFPRPPKEPLGSNLASLFLLSSPPLGKPIQGENSLQNLLMRRPQPSGLLAQKLCVPIFKAGLPLWPIASGSKSEVV